MISTETTQEMLNGLNEQQRKAVIKPDGSVLVIAGAGSGKTRVITHRIAYMILQGVQPRNILAITFTNKAAEEMRQRVEKLSGFSAGFWISTFHSMCARILRIEADRMVFDNNFTIYDSTDSRSLIKKIMKEKDVDFSRYEPQVLQSIISKAKTDLLTPEQFTYESFRGDAYFENLIKAVYAQYEKELIASNAVDFDGLIYHTVKLLENHPDIRKKYSSRFTHILIDEYQDTNHPQFLLIKFLSEGNNRVFAVGDPDQSIYAWRGASMENIMRFTRDFPGAETIKLEKNYRSTQNILAASNHLIRCNTNREAKNLWSDLGGGDPVEVMEFPEDYEEANGIAEMVQHHRSSSGHYGDIAVLYRTNAQSRVIEERFLRRNIPYIIVGGVKFYDRMEVKDILAYAKVCVNPLDTQSLIRIINKPARGIGKKTLSMILKDAREKQVPPAHAISDPSILSAVSTKARAGIQQLLGLIKTAQQASNALEALQKIIDSSGYTSAIQAGSATQDEKEDRMSNLEELLNSAGDFVKKNPEEATLQEYMERVSLLSDIDKQTVQTDRVVLMTIHSAKGLEFPFIILTGVEENLLPHERSVQSPQQIEEERRLCYVAMTRAQKKLKITYAKSRNRFGAPFYTEPSRFISELPQDKIVTNKKTQSGLSLPGKTSSSPRFFNKQKRPRGMIEKESTPQSTDQSLSPGKIVYHDKFGKGVVQSLSGKGKNAKVTIVFGRYGIKELLLTYAKLRTG